MPPPPRAELRRALGLVRATAMVVGTIIGASIFVQPSVVTEAVGSAGGVFLAWGLAGVLTLLGVLITAELASAYPETGGVQAFLREAWSPGVGFLWAWAMFWSMHTGIIAVIAMVFGRYVGYFLPLGDAGIQGVAIAAILGLSAINLLGVGLASGIQTAATIGKVAAILVVIVAGFWLGSSLPEHFVGRTAAPTGSPAMGLFAAVAAGLFAFGGWHMVTYTAEETRDPTRTLPRALMLGIVIVTVAYMALNAAYLYVLPLDAVIASNRVAADFADALLGRGGGGMMSALVIGSTFGALAGIVLTAPRVYYALAREGLLFQWVGALHPVYRTPHRATLLQAAWATVLVATGTYRALFTRVIYTEWIFFAAMAVGLLLLRRRPGFQPAWRAPGGALIPLVFAAAGLAVAVSQMVADPKDSVIGLVLVLSGLPVYVWWTRRRAEGRGQRAEG
jgi:APA family basic amino acid/polyamine antiporter